MKTPNHILILAEWYPHEGDPQLGIFIRKHAEIVANFAKVTVVFVQGNKNQKEAVQLKKEFQPVNLIRATYRTSRFKLLNIYRYSKAYKQIKKLVGKADIVHLQVTGRNYLASKYFFPELPYVITEHWSGFLSEKPESLIGETETAEAFQRAAKVSAVSAALAKRLEQRFGRKDISIVPNVIEKHPNQITRTDFTTRMLIVGDLVDHIKNISGIFNALQNIHPEQKIRVDIIGDGPDRAALQSLATTIRNPDIVINFLGRKDNAFVLQELMLSDFLVMNSRTETFSMICAESILAGTPVIATRCGGPDSFVNAGNGILIDVDHPTQLKEAIEFMIRNHGNFNKTDMSEKIGQLFSKKAVEDALKQLYDV